MFISYSNFSEISQNFERKKNKINNKNETKWSF